MILDALAVGRQHPAQHAELCDGASELGDTGLDVLDRDQRHPFEPRVLAGEFFMEPVIVRAASRDGPVLGNEAAHGETKAGVQHAPRDSCLVEEPNPLIRTRIADPGTIGSRSKIVKVKMIESREYLR